MSARRLPAPVHPEGFLHRPENFGAMCHVYTGTAKSASDGPLLLNTSQGVDSDRLRIPRIIAHLALAEGAEATVIEHYMSALQRRKRFWR
ncbi:hypothetical protein KCP69_14795 [Salmonella enterica subsp. enterica]|nr:hypothetical protein KCP69_14795 [Salmonella enterica subsp. enterica]